MNFDYGTVKTVVASIFGTDQDVGKGITDLMVQKLVTDGKYRVIERAALDKIIAEQNFNNSDRADPSSASKIGRILGVDTIILGSITKFGRDDKQIGGVGGGHSGWTGAIAGMGKKESKLELGDLAERKLEAFSKHTSQRDVLQRVGPELQKALSLERYLLVARRGETSVTEDSGMFAGIFEDED